MVIKEQISTLVDNEIQDDQIIDDLLAHEATAKTWQRYHLIGDAMRKECNPAVEFDIGGKVAAALENEPTIMAPKPPETATTAIPPATEPKKATVIQLFSKVGHYAIAASVAGAVLIGVQQYHVAPTTVAPAPVLNTTPFSGSVSPVSLTAPVATSAPKQANKTEQISEQELLEQKRRINAFLQDHHMQQRMVTK